MHHALDLRILTGDIHCFLNKLIILFRSAYYRSAAWWDWAIGIQEKQTESVGEREGRGLNFEKKDMAPFLLLPILWLYLFFLKSGGGVRLAPPPATPSGTFRYRRLELASRSTCPMILTKALLDKVSRFFNIENAITMSTIGILPLFWIKKFNIKLLNNYLRRWPQRREQTTENFYHKRSLNRTFGSRVPKSKRAIYALCHTVYCNSCKWVCGSEDNFF